MRGKAPRQKVRSESEQLFFLDGAEFNLAQRECLALAVFLVHLEQGRLMRPHASERAFFPSQYCAFGRNMVVRPEQQVVASKKQNSAFIGGLSQAYLSSWAKTRMH